jgi:murein DD-endopeptidase MepM/ murein hydrolase activator NlpD
MRRVSLQLIVLVLAMAAHAIGASPSLPQIVELNAGDSTTIALSRGRQKRLTLHSVREHKEPYYQSGTKGFVDATVRVEMAIEVDGIRRTISGGPFHMPVDVNGLAILLSNSKGLSGGIRPDELTKDVRLEVADSVDAWTKGFKLSYPIRNYRWRAMNYQHTYLGIAVNQALLYYHRGEDMGMIPDREVSAAIADGTVTKVPGPTGDGASNSIILRNDAGFDVRYAHLNTPFIFTHLQPGVVLASNDPLGLTGNTWQGKPVRDPHLHFDISDIQTGAFRNSFPYVVEAFRTSFPEEPLAIAGGWRHLYAGDSIELDGSLSLPANGRKLQRFEWKFTDGSKASGKTVTRQYATPGTYSEELRVTDDQGKSDVDFVEVFVLSKNQVKPPPFAMINYFPIRAIHPGTEITFLTRFSNMKDVTIDFGDGRVEPWAEVMTHSYKKSGRYLVTVKGQDAGSGPGTFHVRVIVD